MNGKIVAVLLCVVMVATTVVGCGQVLGDYKNNPRVATIDEMYDILMRCYERWENRYD
jgi:hypothetical protein